VLSAVILSCICCSRPAALLDLQFSCMVQLPAAQCVLERLALLLQANSSDTAPCASMSRCRSSRLLTHPHLAVLRQFLGSCRCQPTAVDRHSSISTSTERQLLLVLLLLLTQLLASFCSILLWCVCCGSQEAGIPRKLAPTIGIAVDSRRRNRSLESLQVCVER